PPAEVKSASTPSAASKGDHPTAPAKPPAPPAAAVKPDLGAVLGGKADGWSPKYIASLKQGMSPADAAKVFPGADQISKFGFSTVPVKDTPGLSELEFYFADYNKSGSLELRSVKLIFANTLDSKEFFQELVDACVPKYGKAKPADVEKQLVTW